MIQIVFIMTTVRICVSHAGNERIFVPSCFFFLLRIFLPQARHDAFRLDNMPGERETKRTFNGTNFTMIFLAEQTFIRCWFFFFHLHIYSDEAIVYNVLFLLFCFNSTLLILCIIIVFFFLFLFLY